MWIAAAEPGGAVITATWVFYGTVVTVLGGVLATVLKAWIDRRRNDTQAAPVAPAPVPDAGFTYMVARDIERLSDRADDNDNRDHVQDIELRDTRNTLDEHHRRLLALERRANLSDPEQ